MTTPNPATIDPACYLTLRELRDRLTAIMAEHDKLGWSERNDQMVVMQLTLNERRGTINVPISCAHMGSYGLHGLGTTKPDGSALWTTILAGFEANAVINKTRSIKLIHGQTSRIKLV